MQQILIHIVPLYFALYAFWSVICPIKCHWGTKCVIAIFLAIASQYPALARSVFARDEVAMSHLAMLVYCWLFSSQILLIGFAAVKDLARICSPKVRKKVRAHATQTGFIGIFACLAIATYGTYEAVKVPSVKEIEITIKKLPQALDGFTITQLSDLHVSALLDGPRLEKIVERTNALNSDVIVITGDIVDGLVQARRKDLEPIAKLQAPCGVFAIEGNHEHYLEHDGWMKAYRELGLVVLKNENRILEINGEKIAIVGLTDPMARRHSRELPNITKAIQGVSRETPIVLLSHQVKASAEYAAAGADLQLSGHTHGGQIFGMHWLVQSLNAGFYNGHYQVGDMTLYVNSGAGLWYGFPVRFGFESEITHIRLKSPD